ncbi:MAG: hypothetical protein KC478_01765 [Bacteriovoracaceae bacterium]|nr:hypothetical protein [Bacteriovoracaceae bacterium]
MLKLIPHKANNSDIPCPEVHFSVEGNSLLASFGLELKSPVFTSDEFSEGYKNWGLWDYDVFELFLSKNEGTKTPYLELQVSPLNQQLALMIETPRQKWFYPETIGLQTTALVEGNMWKSTIKINLDDIPGSSNIVYGNAHAILGNPRKHFSLVPNTESAPDFHRPELFREITQLETK